MSSQYHRIFHRLGHNCGRWSWRELTCVTFTYQCSGKFLVYGQWLGKWSYLCQRIYHCLREMKRSTSGFQRLVLDWGNGAMKHKHQRKSDSQTSSASESSGLVHTPRKMSQVGYAIKFSYILWVLLLLLLIRLNRDPCGNFHYHMGQPCGNFHYHMGQLQKGASEGLFMSGLLRD